MHFEMVNNANANRLIHLNGG